MQNSYSNSTLTQEKQKVLEEIRHWPEYQKFQREKMPQRAKMYGIPVDQFEEKMLEQPKYVRHWAENLTYGALKQLFNPAEWIPETIGVGYFTFNNLINSPQFSWLIIPVLFYGAAIFPLRFLELSYGSNVMRDGIEDIHVALRALRLKLRKRNRE